MDAWTWSILTWIQQRLSYPEALRLIQSSWLRSGDNPSSLLSSESSDFRILEASQNKLPRLIGKKAGGPRCVWWDGRDSGSLKGCRLWKLPYSWPLIVLWHRHPCHQGIRRQLKNTGFGGLRSSGCATGFVKVDALAFSDRIRLWSIAWPSAYYDWFHPTPSAWGIAW